MRKLRIFATLLLVFFISLSSIPVYADGQTEIATVEDLLKIKDDPSGSYILTENIDMKDTEWEPFEFSGTLDGDGHCILNVDIKDNSSTVKDVVDANIKHYDATCNGLFTSMSNATVKNIQILGIKLKGKQDDSAFYGLLAGYADSCVVDNVYISGYCSLTTSGHCFGVSGLIGFSRNNTVQNCTIESTLKCIDEDVDYKDEQFMGGVVGFGYANVTDCFVVIDGYDSDHGYVHDGGLFGCFMHYEYDNYECGNMTGNKIRGQIYFFEDNEDRRAYCEATLGEMMDEPVALDDNTDYFTRNETFTYTENLGLHDYCTNQEEEVLTADSGYGQVGYKIKVCKNCNFAYKYDYTLPLEGRKLTHPAYKDWEEPAEGSTDILVISSHADDEQLFFAGILPYYSKVRNLDVQVVYSTDHIDTPIRSTERENGLWAVGVTHYPESSGWYDQYSETKEDALANLASTDGITEDDVIEWVNQMILKYKPQVIITHDYNGEYGHGQHRLMAYALNKAIELHADEYKSFLKKAYIHLYDQDTVSLDWMDTKYAQLSGMTPFNVTQQYGFVEHDTQLNSWFYEWLYGVNYGDYGSVSEDVKNATITKASQIDTYSPMQWGLIYGDASLDEHHNDFFEGLTSYRDQANNSSKSSTSGKITNNDILNAVISILLIIIKIILGLLLICILLLVGLRYYNKYKRKKHRKKRKKKQVKK